MRITFVISNANLSGGVRAIAEYAERLKARGHHVVVVSRPRPDAPLHRKLKSLLSGKGWPERPNQRTHFDQATVEHRRLDRWRAATDADVPEADVVIATWWETAEWVSQLSLSKGTKVYFVQHHETVFNSQPVDRVKATYRLPMQKICCARWLLDVMREEYGDATAQHVPYGVDHAQFHAPPRGKQPTPTVGLMYSKATFKGCDISLQAFDLAAKRLPGLKLLAFGTIDPDPALPLPASHAYSKQPPQERIRDVYAGCDAWLFASRCEGFGLPLLEAVACRTPVIATPAGAGPEVTSDGGGILVPPEDPAAMADAIVRVCTLDEAGWRAMSEAAARTAERYNWDASARLFEAALERAVADAAAQRGARAAGAPAAIGQPLPVSAVPASPRA